MLRFSAPDHDPLAAALAPPPDESPAARAAREAAEADAQRVSDRIDDMLRAERAALKRERNVVKVLILGQSESGKSTTLKNFRMRFARADWDAERAAWRAVVHLNLIRAVLALVDLLQAELAAPPPSTPDLDPGPDPALPPLDDRHRLLALRLGPLRRVQADLQRRLGAGAEELQPLPAPGSSSALPADADAAPAATRRTREFVVRRWPAPAPPAEAMPPAPARDEAADVIAGCRADMQALWTDVAVRARVAAGRVHLEDSAAFFLDDLARIATRAYAPSDDDVVRARLRTLGVQEHRLRVESAQSGILTIEGRDFGKEWVIYDVGGSRTTRHAWLPFFDHVHAIIFLAPIAAFDERLAEDPRVNRLEDSLLLWRALCASPLLARTTLVVFLNKIDILRRKLRAGARLATHVPAFGDRANDAQTVVKFLRDRFRDTLVRHSPNPRTAYIYPTTAIDTKATSKTISIVRDGILQEHLKRAELL